MSAAHSGVSEAVVVLMELNPMRVYRKARALVSRHPETEGLVTEVIANYNEAIKAYDQFFDDLGDGYTGLADAVGNPTISRYSDEELDLIERFPG